MPRHFVLASFARVAVDSLITTLPMLRLSTAARALSAVRRLPPLAARAQGLLPLARHNQQAAAQSHLYDADDSMRRRLLYRSKQRGWLEMDIMLGDWAAQNLGGLDHEQLLQFQQIIDMENPDLFRWLTGQDAVPDDLDNPLLLKLCQDLLETREPNVTVRSARSFEGKVWE